MRSVAQMPSSLQRVAFQANQKVLGSCISWHGNSSVHSCLLPARIQHADALICLQHEGPCMKPAWPTLCCRP